MLAVDAAPVFVTLVLTIVKTPVDVIVNKLIPVVPIFPRQFLIFIPADVFAALNVIPVAFVQFKKQSFKLCQYW